jgi:hypothetical protein
MPNGLEGCVRRPINMSGRGSTKKTATWIELELARIVTGHGIPKFQSISVPLSQRMPEQEPAAPEAHGNNDEASEGKGYL